MVFKASLYEILSVEPEKVKIAARDLSRLLQEFQHCYLPEDPKFSLYKQLREIVPPEYTDKFLQQGEDEVEPWGVYLIKEKQGCAQ